MRVKCRRFVATGNQLTDLKGCPDAWGRPEFHFYQNPLKSLQGSPNNIELVAFSFDWEDLESLEHIPKRTHMMYIYPGNRENDSLPLNIGWGDSGSPNWSSNINRAIVKYLEAESVDKCDGVVIIDKTGRFI